MKTIVESHGKDVIIEHYEQPCKDVKGEIKYCDHTKVLAMHEMEIRSVTFLHQLEDGRYIKISLPVHFYKTVADAVERIRRTDVEPQEVEY